MPSEDDVRDARADECIARRGGSRSRRFERGLEREEGGVGVDVEQRRLIGEVLVRRGVTDARATRDFPQAEPLEAALRQDVVDRCQERRPEIPVMIGRTQLLTP